MKDLESRIESLGAKIEKMRKHDASSLKATVIGYLLVVIFVFVYTQSIMHWIKKEVSPNNLSAYTRQTIKKKFLTQEQCQSMVNYCRKQAPVWADKLVVMTHEQVIPRLKTKVKELIDKTADKGIIKLKKDVFPRVNDFLKVHAEKLKKHQDIADPEIAKELAKILSDKCESELDKFINEKVEFRIALLKKDLHKMATKPYSKLTRKEAAERRLLVNWVYLMEHDESPTDVFGEFLKSLNGTYNDFLKDFSLNK